MTSATTADRAPSDTNETSDTSQVSNRKRALELLGNLTLREIRSQYKRTTLGRAWSIISPLATIGIFSLVFATIMRIPIEPGIASGIHVFALFLAAALLPWNMISNGVTSGMGALVANAGLLGKVYFPRWIPVISTVLSIAVTACFEIGVLLLVVAVVGGPKVLLFIPVLIVLIALTTVFVAGIALALSIAVVYFRDTQHFMALFMQFWFYATPIIYPMKLLRDAEQSLGLPLETIWGFNPAYRITSAFRSVLYDFTFPHWQDLLGISIAAVVSITIGILVFRKFSGKVVEEL